MSQGDSPDQNPVDATTGVAGGSSFSGSSGSLPPALPPKGSKTPSTISEPSPPDHGDVDEEAARPWLHEAVQQTPSWLTSAAFHMTLLILLALYTLPLAKVDTMAGHLVVSTDDKSLETLEHLDQPEPTQVTFDTVPEELPAIEDTIETEEKSFSPIEDLSSSTKAVELSDFGFDTAPRTDSMVLVGGLTGDALSGRGEKARKALAAKWGTPQSEQAVELALQWFAAHQYPDGGWSLTPQMAPGCRGRCRNPCQLQMENSRNAATALALLPYLGAGQTHQKGKYQKVVENGLYYLITHQDPQTGSFWESGGQMYSHGLASIAVCEAYAMTQDKALLEPSRRAINFIVYAQDPVGGGWRYNVQQPGDTSVLGWQIMALKSGYLAYFDIPKPTLVKAMSFLDSVQSTNGVNYGYKEPGEGPSTDATTAVGILSRMLLGWKKTEPNLELSIEWLSRRGPDKTNLYYDYYATQVMRHWEGKPWERWNAAMRDHLVNTQARQGHEAGSWYMEQRINRIAGRLYCTSMATMILEVYYRHLPIYSKESTEADFPLE